MLHKIFNGVCDYKYEDIFVRLNSLTRYLKIKNLDVLFLINTFNGKISCSSVLDTVSLRITTRSIRDYCTFTVHRNFKVSPSITCVSAAKAAYRSTDIFNKDCILLADIGQFLTKIVFLFSCISFLF
jgi:hypothetical protein